MADLTIVSSTMSIEAPSGLVEIERYVITGNEYDGVTYKFIFPDGFQVDAACNWLSENDYYPDGHQPAADDLYEFTPVHWYGIGLKLVGSQIAYPAC